MQATMEAWNYSNFLCKNYTLNNLDNTLYNVYSLIRTIKELWKSLKRKKNNNTRQRMLACDNQSTIGRAQNNMYNGLDIYVENII